MTWRTGFAVVALALFALGTAGTGVSPAGTLVPGAAASGPTDGAPDALSRISRIDPFGPAAVTNGANPAGAFRVGPGNAFASEDSAGDDGPGAAGTATIPRDRSFTAIYDEDQAFAARPFLVPPATGPPAA
jgi:hypothetical protein